LASSKREREAARRRYAKYQAARAAREQRHRRRRNVAFVVVGALVVTLGISAAVATSLPGKQPESPQTTAALVPSPELAEGRSWTGTIATNRGDIAVELDGALAPQAVASFVSLARDGFFDSTSCHRLVTAGIFVLQCGDPTGTGTGGPGYRFGPVENAPADDVYPAGTIAMARVGGDAFSMGSQFFLVYEESQIPSDSAGGYTVFGRITSGLDVVKAIADEGNGADGVAPASDVIIEGVQVQ